MGGKTAIALGLVAGVAAGGLLVGGIVALAPRPADAIPGASLTPAPTAAAPASASASTLASPSGGAASPSGGAALPSAGAASPSASASASPGATASP